MMTTMTKKLRAERKSRERGERSMKRAGQQNGYIKKIADRNNNNHNNRNESGKATGARIESEIQKKKKYTKYIEQININLDYQYTLQNSINLK